MGRPNKIWFRRDIGWWMVTLGGEKVRLAEGRENKPLAEQKFHELAAVRTHAPEGSNARVADVIDAFLDWVKGMKCPKANTRERILTDQEFKLLVRVAAHQE